MEVGGEQEPHSTMVTRRHYGGIETFISQGDIPWAMMSGEIHTNRCYRGAPCLFSESHRVTREVASTLVVALSTLPRAKVRLLGFHHVPCIIKERGPLSLQRVL